MIPAGPVLSPQQALDHPHIRATGFMQDVDYPGLPVPAPVVRAAVRLSETPGEIVARPPMLGEHTDLSWPNSAMTRLRLPHFDKAASSSGYAP
jgi:crotonobetainyl-CoA:carnitine CoA-transferase CaiB-like acyl-CoA transferase